MPRNGLFQEHEENKSSYHLVNWTR